MTILFHLSLLVFLASNVGSGASAKGHRPAFHRRAVPGKVIDARQTVGFLPSAPNAPMMGHGPQVVSTSGALATITPSPSASLVQITQQSQVVTTYVPQFTLCELPPIALIPVSASNAGSIGPQFLNVSTSYSASFPPGNGTCSTFLAPSQTTVCTTTLTGLITTYPVTDCAQQITFSSHLGYTLVTPTTTPSTGSNITTGVFSNISLITPAPSIQTLTTYYLAPWQDLISAGTPPADVDLKICSAATDDADVCLSEHETWATQLATITTSTTSSINFTATVPGPAQLIVETLVANITETKTTLTMETNMVMNINVITETLSTSRISSQATSISTDTSTITVLPASNFQPM